MRKKYRKLVRKAYNHSEKMLHRLEQLRYVGYEVDDAYTPATAAHLVVVSWMRRPPAPRGKEVKDGNEG